MSKVIPNKASPEASPKLSDPQRKILQIASRRSDHLVVIRKGHELESRSPVSALIRRGFLVETAVGERQPAWKRNSDGASIGLLITPSGLQAIGRAPHSSPSPAQQEVKRPEVFASQQEHEPETESAQDKDGDHGACEDASDQVPSSSLPSTSRSAGEPRHSARPGSKRALIIDLLRRGDGTALIELEAATGWLPHTTRAALTNLRKSGFILERSKGDDGKTLYRIVFEPAAASQPDADPTQLAA